jgi:uncharacterized membrane protein YraQ (UPF0718 family)
MALCSLAMKPTGYSGHTKVRCDVDEWQAEARPADFLHFLRACARVTVRLIPVIIIGVLLSMIIAQMVTVRTFDSTAAKLLAIMIVAAFAVPLALPTFFEIPLALILLASGAPMGGGATHRWPVVLPLTRETQRCSKRESKVPLIASH